MCGTQGKKVGVARNEIQGGGALVAAALQLHCTGRNDGVKDGATVGESLHHCSPYNK